MGDMIPHDKAVSSTMQVKEWKGGKCGSLRSNIITYQALC